jgi:hypothetical protein
VLAHEIPVALKDSHVRENTCAHRIEMAGQVRHEVKIFLAFSARQQFDLFHSIEVIYHRAAAFGVFSSALHRIRNVVPPVSDRRFQFAAVRPFQAVHGDVGLVDLPIVSGFSSVGRLQTPDF